MRLAPALFSAALLVLLATARATSYHPPTLEPGGTWQRTIWARNPSSEPITVSARVRVQASRFWASPRQLAIHGDWVEVGPLVLAGEELREIPVELPVPEDSSVVLGVEIRHRGGGSWPEFNNSMLALSESEPEPPAGEEETRIPFRLVAGGLAHFDGHELLDFRENVVRDGPAWDTLRGRIHIQPPESWGLDPDEGAPPSFFMDGRGTFASDTAPDFATETLIAIRTYGGNALYRPRRLFVRSIDERPDGTLVCRYTDRAHFAPWRGGLYAIMHPGSYLLVAIPRTDAPIEFRRVP